MKKLFMFLAVAGMATFGVSCSSDDGGSDPDQKELKLSADKTTIEEGDSVTFTVSESGAELYIDGTKVSGLTHTFDTKGDYKVQAKKEGFTDSNVVTVKVTEEGVDPDPDPEDGELMLSLVTAPADIIAGQSFQMSIVNEEGNPVDGAELNLLDGGESIPLGIFSEDGVFSVTGPEGTVVFTAVKDGIVSNELEVTINPAPVPVGGGTFTFEGTDYDIDANYLVLMGVGTISDTDSTVYSVWGIESLNDADNLASIVRFTTPATDNGDGTYGVVTPDGTNEQGFLAAVLDISDPNNQQQKGLTNDQITVTTALTQLQVPIAEGDIDAAAVQLGTGAFTLSFKGESTFVNQLQSAAAVKSTAAEFVDARKGLSLPRTNVDFNNLSSVMAR